MGVVIVSGGTFGIGAAISLMLAKRQHTVVAFGVESRQLGSVAENGGAALRASGAESGLIIDVLEGDVSVAADVSRVVSHTREKYGAVDALVNNAAIRPLGSILDTPEDVWDKVIDVNLKGTYLCCREVLPHMIAAGGGRIVNVGSGAGWGKPNMLAYAASKGGIFALSAALAYDHFYARIRVNVVIPGGAGMKTGMTIAPPKTAVRMPPRATSSAAGREVNPDDVAKVVAFLLSDDADVISGAVIDAGSFAHQGGPLPLPN
jgi:NAD(P)-dependent dehydrogenase (short-subunit alcohol dehydrogenase family)